MFATWSSSHSKLYLASPSPNQDGYHNQTKYHKTVFLKATSQHLLFLLLSCSWIWMSVMWQKIPDNADGIMPYGGTFKTPMSSVCRYTGFWTMAGRGAPANFLLTWWFVSGFPTLPVKMPPTLKFFFSLHLEKYQSCHLLKKKKPHSDVLISITACFINQNIQERKRNTCKHHRSVNKKDKTERFPV